jgi:hypothetical protein
MSDDRQIELANRIPQNGIAYHFCTYFDRNYLTRGLALYESLIRHCGTQFVLWVLCFDDETYSILNRLNLTGVRVISQQEFESGDEKLLHVKSERSRVEYYWTCSPSLPLYVLKHNAEIDVVTYLDADLYFFSDPQPIYAEFGDGSILIIEHRYAPEHAHYTETSGIYNVGLMIFRRDENGLACLNWWRERCLEWCYARFEDSKFGDQKYLDDWPQRFQKVVVLQHCGAGVAPWNLTNHQFEVSDKNIQVGGKPLILFHFHGFKIMSSNLVEPLSPAYALSADLAAAIFLPYAYALKRAADQIQQPPQDLFIPILSRLKLYYGVINHLYLLVQPVWLSMLLWQLSVSFSVWHRANEERIIKGFAAYESGDLRGMRRLFLGAIFRNPYLLRKRGVMPLLLKSFFK